MDESLYALLQEAERDYEARSFDAAQEKLKRALELEPHNEQAVSRLAAIYAIRGLISSVINQYFILISILEAKEDFRKVLDVCKWILRLEPENINVRMKIILTYQKLGDNREVIGQSLSLARLLIELGQGDQSIILLQKTQNLAPDNLEVGAELAEIYISYGHIQEAIAQYRKIAASYLERGLVSKAAETYKRLKLVVPEEKEVMIALGKIYVGLGQYKEAEAEFRSVLRLDLNSIEGLMLLGEVCQKKGQYKDAILAFNKVVSLDNQEMRALEKLGELYQEQGKIKDSVKNFISAAQNYQLLGNIEKAVKIYQQVLVMDPTNPVACRELTNLGAPLSLVEEKQEFVKKPEREEKEKIEMVEISEEPLQEEIFGREKEVKEKSELKPDFEAAEEEVLALPKEEIIKVSPTEEELIVIEAPTDEELKKFKKEEVKVKLDKHMLKTGLIKPGKEEKVPLGLIKERAQAGIEQKSSLIFKQDKEEGIKRKTGLIKGKLIPKELEEEPKIEPSEEKPSKAPEEVIQEEVVEAAISEKVETPEKEPLAASAAQTAAPIEEEEMILHIGEPAQEAPIEPGVIEEKTPSYSAEEVFEQAPPEEEEQILRQAPAEAEEKPFEYVAGSVEGNIAAAAQEEAEPRIEKEDKEARETEFKEKIVEVNKLVVSEKAHEAIEKCTEYLKNNPNDNSIRFELAKIYVEKGMLSYALELLYFLKDKDRDNIEYRECLLECLKWKSDFSRLLTEAKQYANILTKQGKTNRLIKLYQDVILLENDNLDVKKQLAELYLANGYKAEGIFHLEYAAEEYIAREDISKAIAVYDKIFSITQDLSVKEKLAFLYKTNNQVKEAIDQYTQLAQVYGSLNYIEHETAALENIIDLDWQNLDARVRLSELIPVSEVDKSVDNLFKTAQIFSSRADKENARDYLEKVLKINEFYLPAYDRLIDAYFDLNDKEKALNVAGKLVDSYLKEKRYNEASAVYKRIVGYDPENVAVRGELSRIYVLSKEKDKAIEELLQLIRTLSGKGEWEEVVHIYKRAVELDGQNFDLYFNLALVYLERLNRLHDAAAEFEKALEVSPQEIKSAQYLLKIYLKLNEPYKVIEIYKRLIAADSSYRSMEKEIIGKYVQRIEANVENFAHRYDLGIIYKELGFLDNAIEQFQQSKKQPELLLKSYNMLGLCFSQKDAMGMFDLAIRQFKRALEIKGYPEKEYLQIKYNLAELYFKRHMYQDSINWFEEIIKENPGFKDSGKLLAEAKELLKETGA